MRTMAKRTIGKARRRRAEDMRPEYSFDYRKARPNRFAGKIDTSRLVVTLDPDISKVFTPSEAVNSALRALLTAMPKPPKTRALRRS